MKFLILLALVVVAMAQKEESTWTKLVNTVSGTGCLVTATPKLTSECLQAYEDEVESRPKEERNDKTNCCAFLALQSCVMKLAKKDCGEDGEAVAKSFMKTINKGLTSEDCVDYGFITCITLMQWAMFGGALLALFLLLSCICCCCCGGRRKGRVV